MPTYDLKKAATAVTGDKRVLFAFCIGASANHLVIAATADLMLKELEKATGAKTKPDFRGVCFRDGDILVFATKAKPTFPRETLLSKALKAAKYGGSMELRQLGADESDGADGGGTPTPEAATASAGAADAGAKPATLSTQWRVAREAAIAGVNEFIQKLRATGDDGAVQASAVVQGLAARFPMNLDAVIANFERAQAASDAEAIATARAQLKTAAVACLGYLKTNQKVIGICEANPFGAPVTITQPLNKVLTSIAMQLK